ncbi:hypothetical protein TCDM_01789 [Trypanosoma cruzi Dm28c]|uniref:Vesicular transport-associated repeat protein n=1 Tax=Trypanosoma cruzi Dm28c TaxID=1416333 RepID=V5B8B7_TRYCR|nr:hypothetical protein TCDM_01789 [Trypanosoma cruzi Dm28c]
MADTVTAPTFRDYTATFSAAMPPVLSSQSASFSALLKPTPTALTKVPSIGIDCFPQRFGETGVPGAAMGRTFLGISGQMLHTRQMEAGLVRREIVLRSEFDRLRHADEERMRWDRQREREAMLAEERQRMLDLAKEIEMERAKRTEEQQKRLLAQERELEEWKQERAKEMEEQRRRRMEEEDRLRARQHEREMLLMREEAELRLQVQKSVDDHKKSIETSVNSAAEAVMARLRDEFRAIEGQWTSRLERLQLEHINETASLRQEIERERQLVAHGESQLSETRNQLAKLTSQLEELCRQREGDAHSRGTENFIGEIHQKAIERLQRAFEEDKQSTKQWFVEEQQRILNSHERTLHEIQDSHRAQVRRLEETLDASNRQLREMEIEVQQCKTKLAGAALKPSSASADELRLREELRTIRKQLNEAVDAKQRLERRSREIEQECDDGRKAQQALQLEMEALTVRHNAELRSLREENQQLMDQLTSAREAHAEELQQVRNNQRKSESAVTRDAAKEFETTLRRMNERNEETRRALELEKGQLVRQLREAEQRCEDKQRRLEIELEKSEAARRDGERIQQKHDEKERALAELQETVEELKRKGCSVADLSSRNRKLQQELEQLRHDHETATRAKDSELQELRHDLAETRRRVVGLQDELTAARRMQEEVEVRMKSYVSDAELKEKQLRRSLEEATQSVQSWKDSYTQLQSQSASAAPKMQGLLSEKETELSRLQETLDALKRDKNSLEKRTQELQTISATREKEMLDQASVVKGLNAEIVSLREQLSTVMRPAKEMSTQYLSRALDYSQSPRTPTVGGATDTQPAQPKSTVDASKSSNLSLTATAPMCSPQVVHPASDFIGVFSSSNPSMASRPLSVRALSHALTTDASPPSRSGNLSVPVQISEGVPLPTGRQSIPTVRPSLPGVFPPGVGTFNSGTHVPVGFSPLASAQANTSASASRSPSVTVPAPSTSPTAPGHFSAQSVVPVPVPVHVPTPDPAVGHPVSSSTIPQTSQQINPSSGLLGVSSGASISQQLVPPPAPAAVATSKTASLVSSGVSSTISVPVPLSIPNPAAGDPRPQSVPLTSAPVPVPIPLPIAPMATAPFSRK